MDLIQVPKNDLMVLFECCKSIIQTNKDLIDGDVLHESYPSIKAEQESIQNKMDSLGKKLEIIA